MLILTVFVVVCVTGTWVIGLVRRFNPTAASVYGPGSWREPGLYRLHRLHVLMLMLVGTNFPVDSQPADLHGLFCVGLVLAWAVVRRLHLLHVPLVVTLLGLGPVA